MITKNKIPTTVPATAPEFFFSLLAPTLAELFFPVKLVSSSTITGFYSLYYTQISDLADGSSWLYFTPTSQNNDYPSSFLICVKSIMVTHDFYPEEASGTLYIF